MKKGGKRPGAGRKTGTRNKSTMQVKDLLDKCVDFEVVVEKLFELVKGVEVQKFNSEGPQIYEEKPDAAAAKILLEYRFGKAKQDIKLDSPGIEKLLIERKILNG